jgi:putative tryptophan/tyrosine transport system substrate-binding protein
MQRREFVTLLCSAAATWPLAARAQQPAAPVVGLLHAGSPEPYAHQIAAFRQGLNDIGYVEGQNLTIEYRWADNQFDRISAMAADLVRRQVKVIAVAAATISVRMAMAATTTIPIVFGIGGDPVKLGYVASFNRPGGNVTGISFLANDLEEKQLHLLHELAPTVDTLGFLVNPNNANTENATQHALAAARTLGRQLHVLKAGTDHDFEPAFAALNPLKIGALLVYVDPLFVSNREKLVALAARHAMPAVYGLREFAAAGGLLSYGASLPDIYRKQGAYVGRVLKGEKPADLPVQQPTKFEFVLNLKTAKALRFEIPTKILALADEVIE